MTNTYRNNRINLREVTAHNRTARHALGLLVIHYPALAEHWHPIDTALRDTTALVTELAALRGQFANLLAAAQATLGAADDGEADPLYYLRDELRHRQYETGSRGRA